MAAKFQLTRAGNRLDFDLQGKLDREQMAAALDEFDLKSAGIEHGILRCRISDFHFPSVGALAIELSRLPLLFRVARHFDRAAILADESWFRRVSEWEGKLVPGFELKAFPLDQETAAEHWLKPPLM